MGVIPVSMHSASSDVVRYALAIFSLLSRCTRTYLCLFCLYSIASFHTGVPYISKGRMATLHITSNASFFRPHDSFAALDKLYIIFMHLSTTYLMCSWNVNLWSKIIHKYLICVTSSSGWMCKQIVMYLFPLRFLLVTSITLDFLSLNCILFQLDHSSILLIRAFHNSPPLELSLFPPLWANHLRMPQLWFLPWIWVVAVN